MKCVCTFGSRAPASFSGSAALSCACPTFRREKLTDPNRYVTSLCTDARTEETSLRKNYRAKFKLGLEKLTLNSLKIALLSSSLQQEHPTQWLSAAPFTHKHKGRWRNFYVFGALSLGLNFNILWNFSPFFCYAVSSYDHSHPYFVSECLFLAENKAFPYPRRVRAILWVAAATCYVGIFVVVAAKKRSPNLACRG